MCVYSCVCVCLCVCVCVCTCVYALRYIQEMVRKHTCLLNAYFDSSNVVHGSFNKDIFISCQYYVIPVNRFRLFTVEVLNSFWDRRYIRVYIVKVHVFNFTLMSVIGIWCTRSIGNLYLIIWIKNVTDFFLLFIKKMYRPKTFFKTICKNRIKLSRISSCSNICFETEHLGTVLQRSDIKWGWLYS